MVVLCQISLLHDILGWILTSFGTPCTKCKARDLREVGWTSVDYKTLSSLDDGVVTKRLYIALLPERTQPGQTNCRKQRLAMMVEDAEILIV